MLALEVLEEEVPVAWCLLVGGSFARLDPVDSERPVVQIQGQPFGLRIVHRFVDMAARFQFEWLVHYLPFEAFFTFWAKMAFLASAPPAFLPAAIFLGVAFPKEPSVPFCSIFFVAF